MVTDRVKFTLNPVHQSYLGQIGSTSGLKTSWIGSGIRREMAPGTGHTETQPLKWTHSLGYVTFGNSPFLEP